MDYFIKKRSPRGINAEVFAKTKKYYDSFRLLNKILMTAIYFIVAFEKNLCYTTSERT